MATPPRSAPSSRLCAQIKFHGADLTEAGFQEASIATTGEGSDIDFGVNVFRNENEKTQKYETSLGPAADLTKADFQKASFTTTGKNADVDFSGAKLNDANFKEAVVKASGENSAVKHDPTD